MRDGELLRLQATIGDRPLDWYLILENELPEVGDIVRVREEDKPTHPFVIAKVTRIDKGKHETYFLNYVVRRQ